jgi:hypothetical protein
MTSKQEGEGFILNTIVINVAKLYKVYHIYYLVASVPNCENFMGNLAEYCVSWDQM